MNPFTEPPPAARGPARRQRFLAALTALAVALLPAGASAQYQLEAGAFNDLTPVSIPTPIPGSNGLTGDYYNSRSLTGPVILSRVDSTLNFNWGADSPHPSISVDDFSVRWTGFLNVPATGTYTIYTTSDDGVRLRINNILVVDQWRDQGPTEYSSGAVTLNAGLVPVRLEYYEAGGGAMLELRWEGPGIAKEIIPATSLVAAATTLPEGPPVTFPAIAGQTQGPSIQSTAALSSASSATSDATQPRDRFPGAIYRDGNGQPTGTVMVLEQSQFGYPFSSGVPRYMMGDFISPPLAQADGVTPAGSNYWRVQPVLPGEVITHTTGAPETPIPANATLSYYYSPHARRVFASQPGNVTVKWISRLPAANGRFQFRDETFTVSQSTRVPVKKLYWTEGTFKGPAVSVPTGRITTIQPIFNSFFPRTVPEAYLRPGEVRDPGNAFQFPEIKTTLWLSETGSPKTLRAYNVEGRVLVEYLGSLKPDGVTYEFLGADVVEVAQQAPDVVLDVKLGEQILPEDGDTELIAAPLAETQNSSLYGTSARGDGRLIYHAEQENLNPDRSQFYWLEQLDAAIYDGTTAPGLDLAWPKYLNKYRHIWPLTPEEYAQLVVPNSGSTGDTRVFFSGGLPQIMWQDDGGQSEAVIDVNSQGFTVRPDDGRNRTLLKFTNGTGVWYVRVNSQTEDSLQTGTTDGTAFTASAVVGQRIERPAVDLELAGHISAGNIYHAGAWLNPYTTGVAAAAAGSIIPVNAMPGNDQLKVWWFRKINPPNDSFQPFYVATRLGTYTVGWPSNPGRIVMLPTPGAVISGLRKELEPSTSRTTAPSQASIRTKSTPF